MIRGSFEYLSPKSIPEALEWLSSNKSEAKIYAGGTSLLILMKERLFQPEILVNIKEINSLRFIEGAQDGSTRIGTLINHSTLENNPLVGERYPIITEMEGSLASKQIRNLATIGGSLSFGEPAADPPPVFMVLGAKLKVQSRDQERIVALEHFYKDYYLTDLAEDEMVTEILLPAVPPRTGHAYHRLAVRQAIDKPIVSVAASITLGEDLETCLDYRIALGGVSTTPLLISHNEPIPGICSSKVIDEIVEKVRLKIDPVPDLRCSVEYKREMISVLTQRALRDAVDKARL